MPLDFTDLIPTQQGRVSDDDDRQGSQANFTRNKAWTKPDAKDFTTKLTPYAEGKFREWVKANNIPFDPDSQTADYDMRGFWQESQDPADWKALQHAGKISPDMAPAGTKIDPNDGKPHYPDYWKTPYHATFSNQSQWADPDKAPHWDGDRLVGADGKVVFDDAAQKPAQEQAKAAGPLSFDDLIPQGQKPADETQPIAPSRPAAIIDNVANAAIAGAKQGWGSGENPETVAANARADRDFPNAAPLIHGVNWLADNAGRPLSAAFRGAQSGVAQIATELGMPGLGRDLAATPEAFAGMPEALRTPEPVFRDSGLRMGLNDDPNAPPGGTPAGGPNRPSGGPRVEPTPGKRGAAAEAEDLQAEIRAWEEQQKAKPAEATPDATPDAAPASGPASGPGPRVDPVVAPRKPTAENPTGTTNPSGVPEYGDTVTVFNAKRGGWITGKFFGDAPDGSVWIDHGAGYAPEPYMRDPTTGQLHRRVEAEAPPKPKTEAASEPDSPIATKDAKPGHVVTFVDENGEHVTGKLVGTREDGRHVVDLGSDGSGARIFVKPDQLVAARTPKAEPEAKLEPETPKAAAKPEEPTEKAGTATAETEKPAADLPTAEQPVAKVEPKPEEAENAHGGPWTKAGQNAEGETVYTNPNGVHATFVDGVPWAEATTAAGAPADPDNRKPRHQVVADKTPQNPATSSDAGVQAPDSGSPQEPPKNTETAANPAEQSTDSQPTGQDGQEVEYTTKKGRVLKGTVRTDLDAEGARAIDPYAFQYPGGGWFIRSQPKAQKPKADAAPKADGDKPKVMLPPGDAYFPPVHAGERLRSKSGRELAPVPNFTIDSNRAQNIGRAKLNEWLFNEATKEAEASGDRHLMDLMKGLNPKNFSQSDRDMANDILFGDDRGPGEKHRIPPDAPKADEPKQEAEPKAEPKPAPPKQEEKPARREYDKHLTKPGEKTANKLAVDALNGDISEKDALAGLAKLVRDGTIPEGVARVNLSRLKDWSEGEWQAAIAPAEPEPKPKAPTKPKAEAEAKPARGMNETAFRNSIRNTGAAQHDGQWRIVPLPFVPDRFAVEYTPGVGSKNAGERIVHGAPEGQDSWTLEQAQEAAAQIAGKLRPFDPKTAAPRPAAEPGDAKVPPAAAAPPPPPAPTKSWAPEVFVEGKWSRNGLRFATREEAEASARELWSRWMMASDSRATEADEPVNYRWDKEEGLVAVDAAPPETAEPPAAPPESAGPFPATGSATDPLLVNNLERLREEYGPDGLLARMIAQILHERDQMPRDQDRTIRFPRLQQVAEQVYGGTLADNAFARDRLYDALESGVNFFIAAQPARFAPTGDLDNAKAVAADLEDIKSLLPTQTVRAGDKDTLQQFSTPPDYAFAAAWVANLTPGDRVLEPSAGTGGLAVHAMTAGVSEVVGNEISEQRRTMMANLPFSRITGENAEQLNNILADNINPTVVIMNPPFSSAGERMGGKMVLGIGATHIEQALKRLQPGGRLVAIVGRGMSMEAPTFRDWWKKMRADYDIRANIQVGGGIYRKYGTTFATRLLVFDKVSPSGRPVVEGDVTSADALLDLLSGVRDDRPEGSFGQSVAGQPSSAPLAQGNGPAGQPATAVSNPVGGVRPGSGSGDAAGTDSTKPADGGGGQPTGIQPPGVGGVAGNAGNAAPVQQPKSDAAGGNGKPGSKPGGRKQPRGSGGGGASGAIRPDGGDLPVTTPQLGAGDHTRPDGSDVRNTPPGPELVETGIIVPDQEHGGELTESVYESYTPQRIDIEGAQPHPGALVQSAAMASVLPPIPNYNTSIPKELIASGALSNAQLEAIIYAGNAHQHMLPKDYDGIERRRGFFIGDGTGVGKGREVAGIILDNRRQGRKKAVWVSEKLPLSNDAKRDWTGLGGKAEDILPHNKVKAGDAIKHNGILFTSYDTLKSGEKLKAPGDDEQPMKVGDRVSVATGLGVARVAGTLVSKQVLHGAAESWSVKFDDGVQRYVEARHIVPESSIPKSRVQQIVDWLGADFDGVIAFDESHNMGNAVATKGTRGTKQAAAKALAGLELQKALPNARVVYVSATGATEVSNLAYADRLGLWGPGTAFPTRDDFRSKVASGGVAAMELVARDMKALGLYMARSLSYDGVEYDRILHPLEPLQHQMYDKIAEAWQIVLQNFMAALETTEANGPGGPKSGVLSAFWGGHQRFFNQLITSLQMPSVLENVEKDIAAGRQAVLQLVNTNEAGQERALEKNRANGEEDLEDLDMSPRDQLMQLVDKAFPTLQYEEYADAEGNIRVRPVVDSEGRPVHNKEAIAAKERLLDDLGSLRVPDGPLEILMNHFGADAVAEVTGRKQRVVKALDPDTGRMKTVLEKRGNDTNIVEAKAFQDGKKKILVFSQAGGTGRSYHAELSAPSANARRSHYLVQAGWRADTAVQGFGRTHRTNQASAPIFHLVTTDLEGQKRFISSIARRLGQLGALTKGERRTGDQGMFGLQDNLESDEAKAGLTQLYRDIYAGDVEGITVDTIQQQMGLKLVDEATGMLRSDLPPMTQFLNRILSLKVNDQNHVFGEFAKRFRDIVDRAAADGTLDAGTETYRADKITKKREQVVYTDPNSGAETRHVHLETYTRNHPVDFATTNGGQSSLTGRQAPLFYVQNERSGNISAVSETTFARVEPNGMVTLHYRVSTPLDYRYVPQGGMDEALRKGTMHRIDSPSQAQRLWDKRVAETPEFQKSDLHMITGAVLPIWDRLGGQPKIYRLQTDAGERLLGRVVENKVIAETLHRLGAEGVKIDATPAEVIAKILDGAVATLANGWEIKRSRVASEWRLELKGGDLWPHAGELAADGVFRERIAYDTRYFIPSGDNGPAVIEAVTRRRPITALTDNAPPGGLAEGTSIPLYSAVQRAADGLKQAKGTGEQMLSMLSKTPGVKPEEMEWLGLPDWLRGQKTVTKEQIQDYVRANALDVQEVVLGGSAIPLASLEPEIRALGITKPLGDVSAAVIADAGGSDDLQNRFWRAIGLTPDATQYDQYKTAGGENYREMLITLPPKPIEPEIGASEPFNGDGEAMWNGRHPVSGVMEYPVKVPGGADGRITYWPKIYNFRGEERPPKWVVWTTDVQNAQMNSLEEAREVIVRAYNARNRGGPERSDVYRSNHWKEPNVVAHVRFDEREAADGARVLMIQEVQSDWHQAGRKEGYRKELTPEDHAEVAGLRHELEDIRLERERTFGRLHRSETLTPAQEQHSQALFDRSDVIRNQLSDILIKDKRGIPDAPFKTSWPALVMKRMIKYAVDNGVDRVAWSPGSVHADRYSLAKHIASLHLEDAHSHGVGLPNMEAPFTKGILTAYNHQGRRVIDNHFVQDEQALADLVGKEVSERLLAAPAKAASIAGNGARLRSLKGLALEIGGQGMKGFYDQILPKEVGKIVGKYGAQVGRSEIPIPAVEVNNPTGWTNTEFDQPARSEPVHQFDITPALRDAVQSDGLALFDSLAGRGVPGVPGVPGMPARRPASAPQVSRWVAGGGVNFRDMLPTAPLAGHDDAADWVLERGRATGHEHLAVIDNKTGQIVHAGTNGETNAVGFAHSNTAGEYAAYTMHHNHPSSSAISDVDIQILANPGISHVLAHSHDGTTTRASLGPSLIKPMARTAARIAENRKALIDARNAVTKSAAEVLMFAMDKGQLTKAEACQYYNDVVNRLLHAWGVIDYVSGVHLPDPIRAGLRSKLKNLGLTDDVADRNTKSVLASQRNAGLPQAERATRVQERPDLAGSGGQGQGDAVWFGRKGLGLREEKDPLDFAKPPRKPVAEVRSDQIVPPGTPGRLQTIRQWGKDNLRQQKVRSEALGADVTINYRGIKKAADGAGDDILSAFPAIPDLIARGDRLAPPQPPKDPAEAKSTRAWHLLGGVVRIDGREVSMFVNIREDVAGNYFYNLGSAEGGVGLPTKAGPIVPGGTAVSGRGPAPDGDLGTDPTKNKPGAGGLGERTNALNAFGKAGGQSLSRIGQSSPDFGQSRNALARK